mmetsp:Transcript_13137/g.52424  ORF Transcript_13137/g.52424 Transcript_13137/m.52424 type:complete len:216 (-) Transcript_13137:653-1300(-)
MERSLELHEDAVSLHDHHSATVVTAVPLHVHVISAEYRWPLLCQALHPQCEVGCRRSHARVIDVELREVLLLGIFLAPQEAPEAFGICGSRQRCQVLRCFELFVCLAEDHRLPPAFRRLVVFQLDREATHARGHGLDELVLAPAIALPHALVLGRRLQVGDDGRIATGDGHEAADGEGVEVEVEEALGAAWVLRHLASDSHDDCVSRSECERQHP